MTLFSLRYTYISSAGPTARPLCASLLTWHLEEKRLKSRFHTFVRTPGAALLLPERVARGGLFQLQEVDFRAQSPALGIMTTVPPRSFSRLNGGWLPGTPGDQKPHLFTPGASFRGIFYSARLGLKTLSLSKRSGRRTWEPGSFGPVFTACRHGLT